MTDEHIERMIARSHATAFANNFQSRRPRPAPNPQQTKKQKISHTPEEKAAIREQDERNRLKNLQMKESCKAAKKKKLNRSKKKKGKPPKARRGFKKSLHELGFSSYHAYLCSIFWEDIRGRVFMLKGRLCINCRAIATQIHHSSYDHDTMAGKNLANLHPVCAKCHDSAERDKGKKRGLKAANKWLGIG